MFDAIASWFSRREPADHAALEAAALKVAHRGEDALETVPGLAALAARQDAPAEAAVESYLAARTAAAVEELAPGGTLTITSSVGVAAVHTVAVDAVVETADRLPAPEMDPDWGGGAATEPPAYTGTTGRVLADIDAAISESLQRRNQFLRGQLRDVTADLARERSQRQDAQAQLAAAEERIAELELTVKSLGEVIAHAAGHDKGDE